MYRLQFLSEGLPIGEGVSTGLYSSPFHPFCCPLSGWITSKAAEKSSVPRPRPHIAMVLYSIAFDNGDLFCGSVCEGQAMIQFLVSQKKFESGAREEIFI